MYRYFYITSFTDFSMTLLDSLQEVFDTADEKELTSACEGMVVLSFCWYDEIIGVNLL